MSTVLAEWAVPMRPLSAEPRRAEPTPRGTVDIEHVQLLCARAILPQHRTVDVEHVQLLCASVIFCSTVQ